MWTRLCPTELHFIQVESWLQDTLNRLSCSILVDSRLEFQTSGGRISSSLVPRPLHHSAKKNGPVHEVQILGSVPRNEERPISGHLVEKRV